TTAIALTVGLGVGFLLEPGKAGVFNVEESFEAESPPPIMETLINIIPENPFEALTSGDMLQIIAFALFIGMAIAILGEKTKGIYNLFEQANEIFIYLVYIIMKNAHYGGFFLLDKTIIYTGFVVHL